MLRAAIIGGGVAGLTCAYRLKQRGIECVVFESSERTGGRATAAPYLLGREVFKNTFQLIEDVGLSGDVLTVNQTVGQLYRGQVYYHHVASATGLLHFKGLGILDKALLPRMALFLSRHAQTLDLHEPAKGLVHDDESVAQFIKRGFSQNILNYVAGPLISSLFFYGSEETSKLLYLLLAKYMHSTRIYTLRGGPGGNDRLCAALAARAVVRRAVIQEIARGPDGFRVAGEDFSHVVVATPGDAVLRIRGIAEMLSEEDRVFFEKCRYQSAVAVLAGTDRPVDGRCYSVSIPRVEKLSASTITFYDFIDPGRVPAGEGLLSIVGGGEDVTEGALLSDLKRIYSVEPRSTHVETWSSAMPKFPPGRFKEIADFQSRKRSSGLVFCGDYLMGPFLESAVTTGNQAAGAVSSG